MNQRPPQEVISIIERLQELPKVGDEVLIISGNYKTLIKVRQISIFDDEAIYIFDGLKGLFAIKYSNGIWTRDGEQTEVFWDIDWNYEQPGILPFNKKGE